MRDKIQSLKRQRNAVILAHNYQRAEVQDIADFVGDSFELSQNAARSQAEVIVFCGVHFMAETASILCPDKQVLLPNINAGCNMADMITADGLRQKKREHPQAAVVCYINTSAEVKAECDACCTSANAVKVVQNMPGDEIIFVPDQYLGHFVATRVKKTLHLWPGFCPTHMRILPEHIRARRQEHPQARVVVHPECTPQVIALADEALGTGAMIRLARSEAITEMVVGTEIGIIHRLQKENPDKKFIPASELAVCPNMKLITLESILWCLEDLSPEVRVDAEVARGAKRAVDRMLQTGG
ncbi:MAG TPA: quinolinate synthase NadA [Dehalococcoidia bacterium]|nr:quinolinate synthase NadA [Dehalococcoidia bacterium]